MRVGIAADHGGFTLKEDLGADNLLQQVMTLSTSALVGWIQTTTTQILLFLLPGRSRQAEWSAEWPFAAAVWAHRSAQTKCPVYAPA